MSSAADLLFIEVGSTLTKVIALRDGLVSARARALTTPANVRTGVEVALAALKSESGTGLDDAAEVFVASSAAGGLRMTVHGLTRDLTARAAREASLGAGANIRLITHGKITRADVEAIRDIAPSLIMIAGGVEGGEEDLVLDNCREIAGGAPPCPVLYAGNVRIQDRVREIFASAGCEIFTVDNVYPSFDELNVEPVRKLIQELFARRLALAPGTEFLRGISSGEIIPVPTACLRATELLAGTCGDALVVDVGGATTDVHSVINTPSAGNIDPQVRCRRTVEGDLGLFVSADTVWKSLGHEGAPRHLAALPESDQEKQLSRELAAQSAELALVRHAGRFIAGATLPDGSHPVRGRDLRSVRIMAGTGGGLCRLPDGAEILGAAVNAHRYDSLLPGREVRIVTDNDYIFSCCGAICSDHPELAGKLILASINRDPTPPTS